MLAFLGLPAWKARELRSALYIGLARNPCKGLARPDFPAYLASLGCFSLPLPLAFSFATPTMAGRSSRFLMT